MSPHVPPPDRARLISSRPREPTLHDDATTDPLIGQPLDGRYELLERLGHGGSGVVYRARQRAAGRDVAIKLVRESLAGSQRANEQLLREARVLGQLQHPNVVAIHDVGRTDEGLLYLVMELLTGDELSWSIVGRPLAVGRVRHVGAQIAAALEVIHAAGVAHRDLKPDNVILTPTPGFGELVKLVDFGIARGLGSEAPSHRGPVATGGTPHYMSPEHVRGEPIDARSDLYALGVTLYEMLAGRPPFDHPDPARVARMQLERPVPPIPGLGACQELDPALERLVAALLAKRPERRPSSAREVRRALTGGLAWPTG